MGAYRYTCRAILVAFFPFLVFGEFTSSDSANLSLIENRVQGIAGASSFLDDIFYKLDDLSESLGVGSDYTVLDSLSQILEYMPLGGEYTRDLQTINNSLVGITNMLRRVIVSRNSTNSASMMSVNDSTTHALLSSQNQYLSNISSNSVQLYPDILINWEWMRNQTYSDNTFDWITAYYTALQRGDIPTAKSNFRQLANTLTVMPAAEKLLLGQRYDADWVLPYTSTGRTEILKRLNLNMSNREYNIFRSDWNDLLKQFGEGGGRAISNQFLMANAIRYDQYATKPIRDLLSNLVSDNFTNSFIEGIETFAATFDTQEVSNTLSQVQDTFKRAAQIDSITNSYDAYSFNPDNQTLSEGETEDNPSNLAYVPTNRWSTSLSDIKNTNFLSATAERLVSNSSLDDFVDKINRGPNTLVEEWHDLSHVRGYFSIDPLWRDLGYHNLAFDYPGLQISQDDFHTERLFAAIRYFIYVLKIIALSIAMYWVFHTASSVIGFHHQVGFGAK